MRKSLLAGFLAATLLVGCSAASKNGSLADADHAAPVVTSASNGSATITDAGVQLYPGKAKAGAPQVVVFTDFQCPACKQLENYFGEKLLELAKNGDIDLRIVTLTFLDSILKNTESEQASIAALCTVSSGHYPEAYQTIYKNQPHKEGDPFDGTFLNEGLPNALTFTAEQTSAYQKCRADRATLPLVTAIDKAGRRELQNAAKRIGTPTLLVNGKTLDNQKLSVGSEGLLELFQSMK